MVTEVMYKLWEPLHSNFLTSLKPIMCQTSTLFAQNPKSNETENDFSSVLELNLRCLDYHFEDFLVLLETLTPKPDLKANTEPWMTENDPLGEFQIDRYQPIVSILRKKFRRRSEVVAFYVKKYKRKMSQ